MKHYKYMVVGNGLMGSAAARYLSAWSDSVAVVGPAEPADQSQHDGVFSSHYDQGRLTRELSQDPIWSVISRRAVRNYGMLEEKSGVPFHGPWGAFMPTTPRPRNGAICSTGWSRPARSMALPINILKKGIAHGKSCFPTSISLPTMTCFLSQAGRIH